MEVQYISLNMTPTGVNPCFHISQYDVGRTLGFIVHSGGATVDLDTYTCTVEATRSDGTAITSAVATTDNMATFEVTPTMSNKADKYRCQLVIIDANSKRIASLPFDMDVTKAAMDENSESIEEDASLYQQYTEAVHGAIAEANADIQAEENARIAAVSAEATARANADTTLQGNIDAEATARANAITAEATARQTADNTLQDNINSEASTRASADSNLQSQINQIIAPSGEAPSAAEVQNARIGADGVTYSNLGDAIRSNDNKIYGNYDFCLYGKMPETISRHNLDSDGNLAQAVLTGRVIIIKNKSKVSGRYLYSGSYAAAPQRGLVWSFDENGVGTKLLTYANNPSGKKIDFIVTVPDDAVEVRAWSNEAEQALKFEYIDDLNEEVDTLKEEVSESSNDIAKLKNKTNNNETIINSELYDYNNSFAWESGNISYTGVMVSSSTAIRTTFIEVKKGSTISVDNNDFIFRVYKYTNTDSSDFTGRTNELSNESIVTIDNDMFIKITLRYRDEREISDTSISSHAVLKLIFKDNILKINEINTNIWGYDYIRDIENGFGLYIPREATTVTKSRQPNFGLVTIDCIAGDTFYFKSKADELHQLYCFVDENNTILSFSGYLNQSNNVLYEQWRFIVAPTGATKLYITVSKNTNDPHIYKINQSVLASNVLNDIYKYVNLKNRVNVPDIPNIYTHLETLPYDWTEPLSLDDIYAKYDDLVEDYPDLWTKTQLGTDQSGTYPIYRYEYIPPLPTMVNGYGEINYTSDQIPIVITDFGIHGNEKPIVHAGINFFTLLSSAKNNDIWGWLHDNIHFVVCPVVNPWGYVNNVRVNSRHVDLNRNFRPFWINGSSDSSSDQYRGESALSEAESTIVSNTLNEYSNALFYYSWHTHGAFSEYEQMTSYSLRGQKQPELLNVGTLLTQAITRNGWEYHNLPENLGNSKYIGIIENLQNNTAVAAAEGAIYGIPSVDPEGLWKYYDGTSSISNDKVYKTDHNLMNVEYILFAIAFACKQFLNIR
jgi:hypothetical protein